jgi:predicted phage tail protein
MKKNLTSLIALGLNLTAIAVVAQNNQPPAATTAIFAKMYPAATNVDWAAAADIFVRSVTWDHKTGKFSNRMLNRLSSPTINNEEAVPDRRLLNY